ncbi:MAG: hypothetical protein VW828_06765, partial [Candidatus Puniceispirillum sp.]
LLPSDAKRVDCFADDVGITGENLIGHLRTAPGFLVKDDPVHHDLVRTGNIIDAGRRGILRWIGRHHKNQIMRGYAGFQMHPCAQIINQQQAIGRLCRQPVNTLFAKILLRADKVHRRIVKPQKQGRPWATVWVAHPKPKLACRAGSSATVQ